MPDLSRASPDAAPHDDRVDAGLRAKEPARIAGMFDAIAHRYDLLNRVLSGGLDAWWRRRAVRALDLGPSDVLLDVCAGTADVGLAALTGPSPPAAVVGVDFSRQMLKLGLAKTRRRRCARLLLVQSDATRLPLADASADRATMAFGIRNVQEPEVALRELARVVRPGGRLAILEFGLPASPAVRALYLWYARRILPVVGRLVSRHRAAYAYLPESVGRFPSPEAFGRLLQACGFPHVSIVPLTFGIVYLYVATR